MWAMWLWLIIYHGKCWSAGIKFHWKKKKDLATDKKTDLVALSALWYCCLLMEWGAMGVF